MGSNKARNVKGQTAAAHLKYREAIAACDSLEYISYNVSQIARMFGLNGTALANQLRRHYPEILPRREKERNRLGIADNIHRGVRKYCADSYADAVELLWNSDMTIKEAADACGVTYRGLKEHISCYHKKLDNERETKRKNAKAKLSVRGQRTGMWHRHEPNEESVRKYRNALKLYEETSMGLAAIAECTGCSANGFRLYVRRWHKDLMIKRRGADPGSEIGDTKRYRRSTSEKYAEPIRRLRDTDMPVAAVASEFGLNPDVFMMYVKEHEPELAAKRGRPLNADGRRVSRASRAKYAEAIRLYETTSEPLKSIALRLGLTYNSLGGFIRRNSPESIEKHNANLET